MAHATPGPPWPAPTNAPPPPTTTTAAPSHNQLLLRAANGLLQVLLKDSDPHAYQLALSKTRQAQHVTKATSLLKAGEPTRCEGEGSGCAHPQPPCCISTKHKGSV